MSVLPRRISRRGPGAYPYHPNTRLPPAESDAEREAAMDAKWAVWEKLDAQAAGDCEADSFIDRWTADLDLGEYDADEVAIRSEERAHIVRGDQ